MKKIVMIVIIVLFAGRVFAHDPNSLSTSENVRWSVNKENIVTFDLRLPAVYVSALTQLSKEDILVTIKSMVQSWKTIFIRRWRESRTDKDMGLNG